MAKGNHQKPADGSTLDFEARLRAAAERAVPAPHCNRTEYNGARPEGLCLGLSFRADLHPDLKADFILANGMRDLLLLRLLWGR